VKKKVSITVSEGPDKGMTHTLEEGSIVIGRAKSDFVLSDKKSSGRHCQITIEGGRVWIEDLGSTNGTFVGSNRIASKTQLENLDVVIVGLTRMSIAIVDELAEFKELNATGSSSGGADFDLDDLSGEEDPVVDSLLDDSIVQRSSGTKSRGAGETPPKQRQEEPKKIHVELPAPDAEYRDTGIQRIDHLISDELETFSKWDHPAIAKSTDKVSMIPKLKVTLNPRRGPEGVATVVCSQPVTSLGRKDVDVRLNDLDVSRKHAAIEIVGGDKVFVRDLASTNGTYVNGKKVTYQEVQQGDLIQVGQTIFEVVIEG
jgi:pSer/pThr/pTyr-binding forkhead associated (FHA) protein